MDQNAYTTAIDRISKDLERLEKNDLLVLEPPYLLDDARVLTVSETHARCSTTEIEQNLDILRYHVALLEGALADHRREKETLARVLEAMKAERTKLETSQNGKRESTPTDPEPDAKKAKTAPAPAPVTAAPKK